MADGRIARFEVPQGTTPEQAQEIFDAHMAAQAPQQAQPKQQAAPPAEPSLRERQDAIIAEQDRWQRGQTQGLVRGVADIGDTLLNLGDRAIGGTKWNAERRANLAQMDKEHAKEFEGTGYDTNRLIGNVGVTAGIPGASANVLRHIPGVAKAAPGLLRALESGGATTGNVVKGFRQGAADVGKRALGGAAGGYAATGAVSPDDAGTGGIIGAALPPALSAVAGTGRAIGNAFRGTDRMAVKQLAEALGLDTPEKLNAAIAQMRSAETLVPGPAPTLAQAYPTPQAGILQRVVHDSPGARVLQDTLEAQNAARLRALEGVEPTEPLGLRSAQTDLGSMVERQIIPAERAESARIGNMFRESVANPKDQIDMPMEQLRGVMDDVLGAGVPTKGRGLADNWMKEADRIAYTEVPAVKPIKKVNEPTLLEMIKQLGGIDKSSLDTKYWRGEMKDLAQRNLGRFAFKNKGRSLEHMAEKLWEKGYLPNDDPVTLINALNDNPGFTPSGQNEMRALEKAMGDLPQAEKVLTPVPMKAVNNLRVSLNDAWKKAETGREKTALDSLKKEIDAAVDRVARGDAAPHESIPLPVYEKWKDAIEAHAAKRLRFHTGPQASIFRQGGDQLPSKQGAEIATSFWGNTPALKENVQSFKRMIDGHPALLGQFRKMITTEGASTATAKGELTTKFVKWVEGRLPGLKETFKPTEVTMLQRIAADIKRAEKAALAGKLQGGSDTYQKSNNALNLGFIDSPGFSGLANKVPYGGLLVNPLRTTLRKKKSEALANLLYSGERTADELSRFSPKQPGGLDADLLNALAVRSLPVLGATPSR